MELNIPIWNILRCGERLGFGWYFWGWCVGEVGTYLSHLRDVFSVKNTPLTRIITGFVKKNYSFLAQYLGR